MNPVDDIPVGIALINSHGDVVYANHRVREWFAGLVADGKAPGCNDCCNACIGDCSDLCGEVRARLAVGNAERFSRRFLAWSGQIIEVRAEPMPAGFLLLVEDVSDRHADDRLLKILCATLERSPDMVGIAGPNRDVLWMNAAAHELLATIGLRERGAVEPVRIDELQPTIAGLDAAQALSASERGALGYFNTPIFRAGSEQPHAWLAQLIMAHRDDVTDETFYSTICSDITQRMHDEKALQEANARLAELLAERSRELTYSREFLRSLIETNRDLVLSADARGCVTFVNAGIVGAAAGTLIGQPLESLVEELRRGECRERYLDVIEGRSEHCRVEARGGGLLDGRWCLLSIGALRNGGGDGGLTVIVSDLTDLHDARERLRASEKLVATGRMAARIAHEINNPLTGMSGAVQLIKADLPDASPVMRYAELVEREIQRISNIVRQMYGLYRPELDAPTVVDLGPVIEEIVMLMQVDALRRDVKLRALLNGPEPALVQEQNLRQVLLNIIRNAIEVTAVSSVVEVFVERHGRCVDIVVADRGPGVPEEMQQQMFEPFFTTKSTSSGRGLGLGLSISDSLVKAMGGSINFTNRPDGGAECRICLPEAGR